MKPQEALDRIKYLYNEFLNQGYEVIGYHMNGTSEPLENFIIDNISDEDVYVLQQAIDDANKFREKETAKVKCVDIGMDYRTIYKYICLNCGNSSDEITKYCSNCGKELELENE